MKPAFPVARFLLSRFVSGDALESISGDLDEEYALHIRPSRGRLGAWSWYWRETLRSILARRPRRPAGRPRASTIRHDAACAVRTFRTSPLTTTVALVTLALGVGASAVVFSVANAVLIRPLPYGQSDGLVMVWDSNPARGFPTMGPTPANYLDWQERERSFEALAALAPYTATLTGAGEPRRLEGQRTAASLFPLLQTPTHLGRWFLPDEDVPGNDVVIISHDLWTGVLGADPNVIGRRLTLNDRPRTVVGVMPAGFRMPPMSWATGPRDDLWIPLGLSDSEKSRRGSHFLTVVGRLTPGVTTDAAQADMAAIAAALAVEHPRTNTDQSVLVRPMRRQFSGDLESPLRLFGIATALLFVIACLNVAHLLVGRSLARRQEFAVRTALGASRLDLARQLVVEGALLSAAGVVPGLLLAALAVPYLVALAPFGLLPVTPVALDGGMAMFAVVVMAIVAVVCGLLPVVPLGRDCGQSLHHAARPSTAGNHGLRRALVMAQIAIASILLVGAGLLVRSFTQVVAVDPGFQSGRVLTVRLELPRTRYQGPAEWAPFFDATLERLRALPGVEAAGGISWLPLTTSGNSNAVRADHHPPPAPGDTPFANYRLVTPGYFEAMRVAVRDGRTFTAADRAGTTRVAIVNETMAKRFWPGERAVGRRVTFRPDTPDDASWLTVVGVVADGSQGALTEPVDLELFAPFTQDPFWFPPNDLVVRTAGDPTALAGSIRSAVWSVDPAVPVTGVRTLDELVAGSVAGARLMLVLVTVFALTALALSVVGVFGLVELAVAERTREIGIRTALGARHATVLGLVLRQGLWMATLGTAIGCAAAAAAAGLIESQLYQVTPTDPATFVGVPLVLLLAALVACFTPARRALRINPIVALRGE